MGTEKQEELLQIKNLAISFYNKSGEVQAVRGISYTLHKGEVLGIVGESGSGKSVSSHGILRLTPDTGKVKKRRDFISRKRYSENVQEGAAGASGK